MDLFRLKYSCQYLFFTFFLSYRLDIMTIMMIIKHGTKLHAIPRLPARSFAPVPAVVIEDHFKQLLDEVFVISRIIKVEVWVISRSRRLRLITLTETIILDITKTESNNCFIIH